MIRINKMKEPVESFLKKLSKNDSLVDIIDQHFFKKTPAFFALSYFYIYLDYLYPKGGTGSLPEVLKQKIIELGGKVLLNTEVSKVIPSQKIIHDSKGETYSYDDLIWCSDLKKLYEIIDLNGLDFKITSGIIKQKQKLMSRRGGDSIFALMMGVNVPPDKFKKISNPHFFYTPSSKGLGEIHRSRLKSLINNFDKTTKKEILDWVNDYCKYTTYEISIPALRDSSLAPKGKTGFVISFLFEYDLIKKVSQAGWYDEFRKEVEKRIIKTLSESIYPGIDKKVIFSISSTPLSIQTRLNSSEGGIVGWSYELPVPVINSFSKMPKAIMTPIPNVLQAGQWAYSPAGIPTVILTGHMAAQHVINKKN